MKGIGPYAEIGLFPFNQVRFFDDRGPLHTRRCGGTLSKQERAEAFTTDRILCCFREGVSGNEEEREKKMGRKRILSGILAVFCLVSLLAGCGGKAEAHPAVTMNAPYRNAATFLDLVHEKYPEVNLEITPYNGTNTTSYFNDMRRANQMPDIYFATFYAPGRYDDAAQLLDLSAYNFTGNFVQSRLREVTYNGAVYMLPLGYNALGITYNKTLLEKNGWTLPTNLSEMEALKTKAEDAGYTFCVDMLQFPGYGFQYLCNIADTGFLSSTEGIAWQNKFLAGEANVSDTPEMEESIRLLQRWRDIGILNGNGSPDNDGDTKKTVAEGNTLFVLGNSVDFGTELGTEDKYSLMPYLSEDGNHNVFILNVSRYVGLNKGLSEKGNEQKLEDALKVMEVLSTVEGLESLEPTQNNSRLLPLKNATVGKDSFYADILDELNSGHTAGFIYSGWENLVVPLGEKMIDFACGRTDIDEVIRFIDDNQKLITENVVTTYTTATETIGLEDCARAIGIAFAQATGSEAALISTNPWVYDPDSLGMNAKGVSGCLFPLPIGDEEITSILPTGWKKNIETVTLTGARIKELVKTGYDINGNGITYPYVLVTKGGEELDDNTTYTIPVCGVTEDVSTEGNLTDTGILGLDAARNYFSQFETLSAKDIKWE